MTYYPYTNDEILTALEDSPVAGGTTYSHDITQDDADVVVSTWSELEREVGGSADIIWVDDDATIQMQDEMLRPAQGQTIASGRGIDGSEGGLIVADDYGDTPFYLDEGNVRFTGIRLEGPVWGIYDDERYPAYLPYPDTSYSRSERYSNYYYFYDSCGINCHTSAGGHEIDNCEIYGFADMGVNVYYGGWNDACHIHHNYIHDCMKTSMGYGVEIFYARPVIEYNYFNATRHSIAGWGTHESGFIVRNNLFGPVNSSHCVDQHGVHNNVGESDWSSNYSSGYWAGNAGREMEVTNNTFLVTQVIDDSDSEVNDKFLGTAHPSSHMSYEVFDRDLHAWDISIRGTPYPRDGDGIIIERNSFWHDGPQPRNRGIRSFSYPYAINQQTSNSDFSVPSSDIGSDYFTTNFHYSDNQYDNENQSYDPEYGAPVNFDGAVTADFAVNAITEGGEWLEDGIEGVEVTLTRLE